MVDVYVKLPKSLEKEVKAIPKIGVYKSESDFVRDAINTFLAARADIRTSLAVELYREGVISIGRVSELTGLGHEEAKKLLVEKGISLRRASKDVAEMKKGTKRLLEAVK